MKKILSAFLVASLLSAPATAGTITSVASFSLPGFSTGTLGPVGATPAPNNDNVAGASPNVIPYSIFYNAGGLGITDVEFVVTESGGTTEYRITQTLINNTGTPWTGFRYELGFGTGASFVRSGVADFLDFDAPDRDPAPTSNVYSTLLHDSNLLEWTGGLTPSIGVLIQAFQIDVPDGLAGFNPSGQNRFTLRQFALTAAPVPEPAAFGLFGAGLLLVALRRRKAG